MERMRTFAPQTWLRREPDVAADALLGIPASTELEVLEAVGSYYKVSYRAQSGEEIIGYVSQSFLRPVGEEVRRGGFKQHHDGPVILSPKFDRTTGWLAAGIVILLVTNLTETILLWRNMRDVANRPVHATCCGHSDPAARYTWGNYDWPIVDPDYYQDGKVKLLLVYQVQEKLSGSEVVLCYRLRGEEIWQEEAMHADEEALHYSAHFVIDPVTVMDYQVLQRVNGEVLRADNQRVANIFESVGNGDVECYRRGEQNGMTTLIFRQSPSYPMLTARQVEEIIVKIEQKNPVELHLQSDGYSELVGEFKDEGFTSMTITVRYRDDEGGWSRLRTATGDQTVGTWRRLVNSSFPTFMPQQRRGIE
ncbi:MAG: hypothetical protein ACOX2K_06795 [Bacillota bacterium]